MTVIDEQLKEYLDIKFSDVIDEIKVTTKENTKNIAENCRKTERNSTAIETHQKYHDNKKNSSQFSIQSALSVLAIIATILIAVKYF